MPTVTRRLRHWKQRYEPNAAFIWRRRCLFGGKTYEPGERIPAELAANKSKLRRFWEGQIIELAEFEPPAPPAPVTETPAPAPETETPAPWAKVVKSGTSGWYTVTMPDGEEHKANGAKALKALLRRLNVRIG